MRWLMIGLLVSLGALLFAAAGLARHIWLQRRKHSARDACRCQRRPGNRRGSRTLNRRLRTQTWPRNSWNHSGWRISLEQGTLSTDDLRGCTRRHAGCLAARAGIVLAGSALVAVCAHVALPLYFTPVPLTLQPLRCCCWACC